MLRRGARARHGSPERRGRNLPLTACDAVAGRGDKGKHDVHRESRARRSRDGRLGAVGNRVEALRNANSVVRNQQGTEPRRRQGQVVRVMRPCSARGWRSGSGSQRREDAELCASPAAKPASVARWNAFLGGQIHMQKLAWPPLPAVPLYFA
eukprot:scaffold770_cov255-Pinguiococcus_pyrenoidosus.AAC.38